MGCLVLGFEALRSFTVSPLETRRHIPKDLNPGADPRFVGRQAYTIFGALFKKKTTKLRTKMNIHIYMYN